MVKIFFSYSHIDENFRDELAKHLTLLIRQGTITTWHDRRIVAGKDWNSAIDENLENADIILLLVSADFISSDYIWNVELKRAIEKHATKKAIVIPIILRPVDWYSAPFGSLEALPRAGKPVVEWPIMDSAFKNIVEGLRRVIQDITDQT
jgi:hypothetical protein